MSLVESALSYENANTEPIPLRDWRVGRISPFPESIPHGWRIVRLTDYAFLESGHTPSRKIRAYWNGYVPWVSLHDSAKLDEPTIERTTHTITELGLANSSARLLPAGTVVFSRTATVGKATVLGRPMATSQDFACYVCGSEVHNHFLRHLFLFMQPEWIRLMAGSTHNTIYMPVFRELQILLPPEPEQKSIAEALGDVDQEIAALDRLIAKKRDIKQATMQKLLTGETRLSGFSGQWDYVNLGDLFSFKNGLNKRKEFFGHGTPIVNYLDVFANPAIRCSSLEGRVSVTQHELGSFDVVKGDVFFTRTSEIIEEIGMPAVVIDEPNQTVFSGFLLRARPKNRRLQDSFKAYCFRSNFVRRQIISKASYTTRALTNGKALSTVELPVPSNAEQVAIATVLFDMAAEIAALEAKRDKARLLKQGMMQELLTGQTRLT